MHTPGEFTGRGELSVNQAQNYPAKWEVWTLEPSPMYSPAFVHELHPLILCFGSNENQSTVRTPNTEIAVPHCITLGPTWSHLPVERPILLLVYKLKTRKYYMS